MVIVLFLSGMVAMIMLRTLHKDIARYNQMDDSVSWFDIYTQMSVSLSSSTARIHSLVADDLTS